MSRRFLVGSLATLIAACQTAASFAAYVDVTRPGDPVKLITGLNQGDTADGPPPASETEIHAIDDIGQKYLNFADLLSGIAVTPSENVGPVVGVRLYTANDAVDRDPASFHLAGSNDGLDGPWTQIASGNFALPDERNDGGSSVAIPPGGNFGAHHHQIVFTNNDAFAHYQIIFPTLKDAAAANSMQIGEIEFLAAVIPEPSSGILALLGIAALAGKLRRRR